MERKNTLKKIISGGQTGVDQAVLQAAIDHCIGHGGWCPPGRVCEDGIIPRHFKLEETLEERDPSAQSIPRSQRTIWNVRDSDGVLFFNPKEDDPGTKLAVRTAIELGKPHMMLNPFEVVATNVVRNWITENNILILSIGGPSEKNSPGIYERVYFLMAKILEVDN